MKIFAVVQKIVYVPFVLAIVCTILYTVIGTSVDAFGVVHEPFFLIPLAWCFISLGIILHVSLIAKKIWDKKSKH